MKCFTHTLFFFLLITQICFGQWYQQNSGTNKNLYAVQFTDANNGFVVGDSGIILRTTDAGNNWEIQPSETTLPLNDISFVDENKGWIVGGGYGVNGIILNTTDGGETWMNQLDTTANFFRSVNFADMDNGWTVGPCTVSKTTDRGTNWIDLLQGCIRFVHLDVCFNNADMGIIIGSDIGGIREIPIAAEVRTSDGGINWYYEDLPGAALYTELIGICLAGTSNVFAVGGSIFSTPSYGIITKTTDWGITWVTENKEGPPFNDVYFINESNGWIVGGESFNSNGQYSPKSTILRTTDSGETWSIQWSDTLNVFSSVYFADVSSGWVVGDNGTILHTTNGGVTFVEEEQLDEALTEFLLSQNWPNPFNPSTKIKYSVPQTSQVLVKIYDVLANEIETLVNAEKTVGTYELTWNAVNLPSGVYFYQLKTGKFIHTKKMILMK